MKVLHVAPSIEQAYGGPTQSLAGYALAARAIGVDVAVAAPACGDADLTDFSDRSGIAEPKLFHSLGKGAFVLSPSLVRWVSAAAVSYDVVHVHGLLNSISSLAARSVAGRTALVIRPFGTLSRYTFSYRRGIPKRLYFALVDRRNVERADAIHFTTEQERDEARWQGIPFDSRAHVVPPPVVGNSARERPAPVGESPTILFLSRLHPVKRAEVLLDAWTDVVRAVPPAQLIFAGTGEPAYERSLRARAEQLDLNGSVRFMGFVSGQVKADLFQRAAALVLPSQHENFGMAAVEALAAGLPVIISPQVQVASFVIKHRLGVVVNASREALATAIIKTIADSALRERVRNCAPSLVEASFSVETVAGQLATMYSAAAARHRAKS